MRVVCAPNAFKGTLTAAEAADALAAGVRSAGDEAVLVPVADGGDGTLDVLLAAAGAAGHVEIVPVLGPLGDPTPARLGWIGSTTAVVELAEAAGLRLLTGRRLKPLQASTFGVGQLIYAAVAGGATRIIVGVGGSASSDGGLGLLEALGADFRDGDGRPIPAGSGATAWVVGADFSAVLARLAGVELVVAADVDNPLCGAAGAARTFAPQKGADPRQVEHLDAGLQRFALLVEEVLECPGLSARPGMGAAGGSAFGLAAVGATVVSGAVLICDECHLDDALDGADLVITGEGRLDAQTVRGKAPAEVAARSRRHEVPCIAVAGEVDDALPALFAAAHALGTQPGDAAATRQRLAAIGAEIAVAARGGSTG